METQEQLSTGIDIELNIDISINHKAVECLAKIIWEEIGKPEGRDEEIWHAAENCIINDVFRGGTLTIHGYGDEPIVVWRGNKKKVVLTRC